MSRAPRWAVALFALGLALRVAGLPAWGTFDVEVQKAWAARAAEDGLADIYGPSDAELLAEGRSLLALEVPRTEWRWGTASYFVDYPPGSLIVLWAAGKVHGLVNPALENRRGFNVAINLAPLVGSIAIAWLLLRGPEEARPSWGRSLAFWLNPAMLLAAPWLGYQDTIFGAFALAAVLALQRGRHGSAAALVVVAGLIKPQGALLVPALLVVLAKQADAKGWARAALAGFGAAALVLLPWWSQGHLLSALDGCLRPLRQATLAPLGLNLWWIAGWLMDVLKQGGLPLARIVTIEEFQGWAGFDPRASAHAALAAATLAIAWRLARGVRSDPRLIPIAVILQVHAYALVGTSVHENHTLLAVMLAPLLIGEWHKARGALALTSAFAFASLLLAAGFGRRITRQADLAALKALTGIDASVLVALAHVALVALLFVWFARSAGKGANGDPDRRRSLGRDLEQRRSLPPALHSRPPGDPRPDGNRLARRRGGDAPVEAAAGGATGSREKTAEGEVVLLALERGDLPRIAELMAKYADRPKDLADASLVRAAERERLDTVFTLDRDDFDVYRIDGRRRFKILPSWADHQRFFIDSLRNRA